MTDALRLNAPLRRRVAIAIPARDEAERIVDCLERLGEMKTDERVASLEIVVLANNCRDDTARTAAAASRACHVVVIDLPPEQAHAGWARRLALEAAANRLREPGDLLMSTDADTRVTSDWLTRTLDHLDAGWDAVAGLARLDPADLRGLDRIHRLRLAMIQRHEAAKVRLRGKADASEPWPRHDYEGGASIALTLAAFRRIGAAPTPAVGEDKALFAAVKASGGRVRHAMDVKVFTSGRLVGRAPGGASDTLALWGRAAEHDPLFGIATIEGEPMTFAELPRQTRRARALAFGAPAAGDFSPAWASADAKDPDATMIAARIAR